MKEVFTDTEIVDWLASHLTSFRIGVNSAELNFLDDNAETCHVSVGTFDELGNIKSDVAVFRRAVHKGMLLCQKDKNEKTQ